MSEGLQNADGKLMAEAGTRDAFGHAQLGGVGPLIATLVQGQARSYKYHWAVADYLQRAARHLASKTDLEQSYAVGKAAVELAVEGQERGDAGDRARLRQAVSLEDRRGAARQGRQRREDAAARLHHRATASASPRKARAYLAPLMKGEAPPPFKDGLPRYVRLKNVAGAEEARDRVQDLSGCDGRA